MNKADRYDSLLAYYWDVMAERYHVDDTATWTLAKCQMLQESDAEPEAVSPVGARGLMQIMKPTWGDHFDDAFNPEKNITRGLDHLGYLWSEFQREIGLERWKFALGAYNAGLGSILKAQDAAQSHGRPTDQWLEIAVVLPTITGTAAAETIDYVRRIVADYLSRL